MSVSSFRLSVGTSLGLVLQVLVRSLYRRFFLEISRCSSNLQSCVPPPTPSEGVGRSLPSGLAMGSVHPFCSWLSGFLYQVTTLPPSPCLVWISQHTPRPTFEPLTPELRLVYPSPPSHIVAAKMLDLLCSSVCRLHCTDRPNASKIALGNCWVQ